MAAADAFAFVHHDRYVEKLRRLPVRSDARFMSGGRLRLKLEFSNYNGS
jgi:hypothetical protein